MKKSVLLIVILAVAVLLSGCNLVEKDSLVDMATPIITVEDIVVTKAEVLYYEQMQFGGILDPVTNAVYVDYILDVLAEEAVLRGMPAKLGLDVLTEEEEAAVAEKAVSLRAEYIDEIKYYDFAETELEGEELDAAVEAKMADYGVTEDSINAAAKQEFLSEKLRAYATEGVVVTEEDIQADYDAKVEAAKTNYESNLSAYGSAVNNGQTVYYAPAGYRYVKHILRAFSDEHIAAMSGLNASISTQESVISGIVADLASYAEVEEPTEEQLASIETLKQTQQEAEELKQQLEAELETVTQDAYAVLEESVNEVLARLDAQEDFETVMNEMGQDPGMLTGRENGYAICEGFTSFDTAFTDAAFTLAQPGDITGAIKGQNGIHIIKYMADIEEGEVGLESVSDAISAALLTSKQQTAFNEQVDSWMSEVTVKIDKNALK